jgi:D-alanyl-D-alanine carboxypeptidase/D-alanyl-D-alanine-endopeptidase (penicillin-binding protein 4)
VAFTSLLRYIRRHPHYAASFEGSLPQSGNIGSLKNRFVGTPIEGRVRAKTGSISRVNTLSGYVDLADGRSLTFSVQANHHAQGGRMMIAQIDSVVVAMARAVARRR